MQVQIPELSTIETRAIRSSYPSIEHLEAGNIGAWLQERRDQLLVRARSGRSEMNLAKLLTLGVATVGAICYATSPLAPIGALVAGVGYVWSIAQDLNESHQFAPLPFVRGDFLEFLAAMGDRDSREEYTAASDPVVELLYHLEPFERYEFGMLQSHIHVLTDYLSQVEAGKKFYAYRWLLNWFINLRGSFPDKEALANHVSTVGGDPKINAPQVAAIKDYQSQTADCLINGLPPTQVSPLPSRKVAILPAATSKSEQPPVRSDSEPRIIVTPPAPPAQPASSSPKTPDTQKPETIDVSASPVSAKPSSAAEQKAPGVKPNLEQLVKLPLQERAIAIIESLNVAGFNIARCTESQITCIAGNQRGGKGSLLGILAILASALDISKNPQSLSIIRF